MPVVAAAEPDFVGVLALAIEDDVAKALALTDEQKEKLLQLIDAREGEALELALKLKDLPESERAEKLEPFRRDSELKGLALLNRVQQVRLEQIRIERKGLATLAEPGIAEKLELTAEQQTQVAELLKQRDERLSTADEDAAQTVRAEAERKLASLLTDRQRTAWENMTDSNLPDGVAPAEGAPTVQATESSEPPQAAEPESVAADESAPVDDKETAGLRFNFRFQPWKDVLDWFAEQADLSLVLDAPPQGTFNYVDQREYTPAEAIDLLNSVLLTKGYTLVRRGRMLMLINLEDGIPPNLVRTVSVEELDSLGESELVSVLFPVERVTSEEAEAEIKKMIGPQGAIVPLPKSRQIMVTETAGRLRSIRRVIQRIEDPEGLSTGELRSFDLKYVLPEEILPVLRQMLDIPDDKFAAPNGSIRISIDPSGTHLLASGKLEMITRVEETLKAIDVPGPEDKETGRVQESPQLEVYSVATADPEAVLQVMQTLLAGSPDARLAIDPKTGNLIAMARPSQQATIRATLAQLQQDSRRVEVIRLHTVDPQMAVLSINKLFGSGEEAKSTAPQVDADLSTRQLLIRGTEAQITQIRSLLEKMGETDTENGDLSGGNVRMLPISGRAAKSALERIQEIWPTMRKNKIRVVTPSAVIPTMRPGSSPDSMRAPRAMPGLVPDPSRTSVPGFERAVPGSQAEPLKPRVAEPKKANKSQTPDAPDPSVLDVPEPAPPRVPAPPEPSRKEDRSAGSTTPAAPRSARVLFAVQTTQSEPPPDPSSSQPPDVPSSLPEKPPAASEQQPATAETAGDPPVIVVAPGPGGIMIASEDIEALDEFERLLNTLVGSTMADNSEMAIFYLKHAKAATVATILDQIFGGGTLTDGSDAGEPGGGGLLGNLAGAALGDVGGGIVDTLLGLGGPGGSLAPTGSIQITPDVRLNALVVQANQADLDTIEQLLKILDQKESPEDILVVPKAKLIPVYNTQAEEIAEIVKEVYQDRLIATSAQRGQQPSPREFIRMLRGGRRSQNGSKASGVEDVQKMSIGIDPRTNSLIVAAPDKLFEEVKQLVEQLDQAAIESNQAVRVITLHRANPETVQQALSAIVGESAEFSSSTKPKKTPTPATKPQTPPKPSTPNASSTSQRGRTIYRRPTTRPSSRR